MSGSVTGYTYGYTRYNDIGSSTITPTGNLSASNYNISYAAGTLTIQARTIGITWTHTDDLVYSGSAQKPTATATNTVNSDSIGITVTGGQTNAGSYTATASALTGTKAGNYQLPVAHTTSYSINKAPISPTISLSDWVYGSPNNPTITGNTGSGTETVEYKVQGANDNTYETTKPTNVGDYTVRVTIAATSNYYGNTATDDFSITKASITPAVSITGWIYGNSANTPSTSGNPGGGGVTYHYKVRDAADNTYTTTVPTAAGNYTIRATVAQTSNYLGNTATANFTISQRAITIKADDKQITVGGSLTPSFTASNLADGDSEASLSGAPSYSINTNNDGSGSTTAIGSASGLSTGTYYIIITLNTLASDNYTISLASPSYGTLEVQPKSLASATINYASPYTYSGSAQSITPTTITVGGKGLVQGTDYQIRLTDSNGSIITTLTNAGTYILYFEGLNDYDKSHTTYEFTINQKAINVYGVHSAITYGNSIPTTGFALNSDEFVNSETSSVLNGTPSFVVKDSGGTTVSGVQNVGTYYIYPSGTITADNYSITLINTGTLTINRKDVTIAWSASSVTYTGSAVAPTPSISSGNVDGGNLTVSAINYSSNINVNTGYTATATLGGSKAGNYSITSGGTQTYDITAKSITITWSASSVTYTGSAVAPTPSIASGNVDGGNLTVSATNYSSNINVNTGYTATATLGGSKAGNYSISSGGTQTYAITAKSITITWSATSVTYTGSAVAPTPSISSGNVDGGNLTVSATNYSSNINVNTGYTATATLGGSKAGNYSISSGGTQTYAITAKSITITWSATSVTYTGSAVAPTPSISSGNVDGGNLTVSATNYSSNINVNTGYTATATLGGSKAGNYSISSGGTQTYAITEAEITITSISAGTVDYLNGQELTPVMTISASSVNDQTITWTYSTSQNGVYGSLPSYTSPGTKTVYYKATAPNHEDASGQFTYTINYTYYIDLSSHSWWQNDGAVFAAYIFGGGQNKWVAMTNTDDNIYKLSLSPTDAATYTTANFVRMNPSADSSNYSWSDRWGGNSAQTSNVTLYTSATNNNCGYTYKVSANGDNNANGSWYVNMRVYLTPSDSWKADNSRYALYYKKADNTTAWYSMIETSSGSGIYYADIEYANVSSSLLIFCQMWGDNGNNNWETKRAQTGDLTIPSRFGNLYTVSSNTWTVYKG